MSKIAILAGKGHLPSVFAERAVARGYHVVAIHLLGETDPQLAQIAHASHTVHIGQWQRIIGLLKQENIQDVYLSGGVSKGLLFSNAQFDARVMGLVAGLREKNDDAIIKAFVHDLAQEGITVRPQTDLVADVHLQPGILTNMELNDEAWSDIRFGFRTAKALAGLDIGQTVVVKNGAVLAVEAIDGTDATISRGGRLARGGGVAVKVAKPDQDMRFDVPTIGLDTLETAIASGLQAIALEAGKTIIVDEKAVIERANEAGLNLVLVQPEMCTV